MRYDLLRRVPNLIKTLSLLYEVASIVADALDDLVHFRYPLAHFSTFGSPLLTLLTFPLSVAHHLQLYVS